MAQFFKIFFASLLALIVFGVIALFVVIGLAGALASKEAPEVANKTVLLLDLNQSFTEQKQPDPLETFTGDGGTPGLYDAVRLIGKAATDGKIAGIQIVADGNQNSFASSNELRNAIIEFKKSGKPVIAHGDVMSQGAYFVANAANKIYLNPVGALDWSGYNIDFVFFKSMLDKLQIEPQIFYAGKFKSATEPFRTTSMTPENRLQTAEWLGDLYAYFLQTTATARRKDSATLHQLARTAAIKTPADAVNAGLIDAVKYDDEVKSEWKQRLKLERTDKLHLVSMATYAQATALRGSGKDRIAVLYASGNIVDGEGTQDNIGGDRFRVIIRKLRLDRNIKAIVLRVNSGGGSALASENIWRELSLAKKDKPVVVSFGDVAASGGYYIACGADSVFAHPNTITGSIGVFTIVPNMQGFFKEKLGVTFDGVKTADFADGGSVVRPLSDAEKSLVQSGVDRIYTQFKERVATGRKRSVAYIDSIAQGRVWSGADAVKIGLVDRLGGIQAAIDCAARMAKTTDYRLREYPESESWFSQFLQQQKDEPTAKLRQQLGNEAFGIFNQLVQIREITQGPQARLPFSFVVR